MTTLSPQQQAVVNWVLNGRGSLNLVARAGCGKTFTLIEGVVETIVQNRMGEVFIGAYNKAIAEEIRAKLNRKGISWKVAQAGTMHSAGYGAWRKAHPNVAIDDKKLCAILDGLLPEGTPMATARDVIKKAVGVAKGQAFGVLCGVADRGAWYDLFYHFGFEEDLDGEFTVDDLIPVCIEVYQRSLDLCHEVIDFDDMILAPLYFRTRMWSKDWVLIDEAQDTNAARRALALKMLKPRTGRLIAVGDDRQAIYGFTGADSDAMDLIGHQLNSKILPLNVTYRCPKAVVREAQVYVPDFTAHPSAPEGQVINHRLDLMMNKVRVGNSLHYTDFSAEDAVLCRNTKPLIEMAYSLLKAGVACKVEGREIGQGLIALAKRWKVKTLDALSNRLSVYKDREMQKWLAKGREEKAGQIEDKVDTLQVLIDRCLTQGENTVAELVAFINGLFGDTKEGEKPNCLTLSTIHKSKGREWKRVFILGANQYQPSKFARKEWQMRQEDNLSYVAITRAMDTLVWLDM